MASNAELDLLARAIHDDCFGDVVRAGVDSAHFYTADGINLYQYLKKYYFDEETYGETPSMSIVKRWFPGIKLRLPRDSTKALIKDLKTRRLKQELNSMIEEAGELLDEDEVGPAMDYVMDRMTALRQQTGNSRDMDLAGSVVALRDRYELVKSKSGLLGIPTPWGPFNDGTMGMQAGDFILLYGRPGNMKTWCALVIAAAAYLRAKRVLVFSAEMMEIAIMSRLACLICKVDYDAFRKGDLSSASEAEVFRVLEGLSEMEKEEALDGDKPCLKVTTGSGITNGKSLEGIRMKVEEYRPDLVIVDGIYLIKGKGKKMWESMTAVSRGLKDMAVSLGIPIIGVTQANRDAKKSKGGDVADLAYADAFGQDADIVLRIIRYYDKDLKEACLVHAAAKVREGMIPPYVIWARPATNFGVAKHKVGSTAIQEAIEKETADAAADGSTEDEDDQQPSKPAPVRARRSKGRRNFV